MAPVLLLASILVIGLLLGWGLGGSIRNLAQVEVRMWWLFPIALLLQLLPVPQAKTGLMHNLPFVTLLASFVLIGVVVAMNLGLRGFPLILIGVILNLIPITVNQGMPVSGAAVVKSGGALADVPRGTGEKHHLQTAEDLVIFLGDVIAVRTPFRAVVSIGDLVMWIGAAWFVTAAMLGVPRREPRPARAPPARRLRSANP
jgi:uncharacterized protein DUF5317